MGRGLGHLMGGGKRFVPVAEALPGPASLSPGMASLLRAQHEAAKAQSARLSVPPRPVHASNRAVLLVSLVAADVLLVALAAWLVFSLPGRPSWPRFAACAGVVGAGAWLSCLALWVTRNQGHETAGPAAEP